MKWVGCSCPLPRRWFQDRPKFLASFWPFQSAASSTSNFVSTLRGCEGFPRKDPCQRRIALGTLPPGLPCCNPREDFWANLRPKGGRFSSGRRSELGGLLRCNALWLWLFCAALERGESNGTRCWKNMQNILAIVMLLIMVIWSPKLDFLKIETKNYLNCFYWQVWNLSQQGVTSQISSKIMDAFSVPTKWNTIQMCQKSNDSMGLYLLGSVVNGLMIVI